MASCGRYFMPNKHLVHSLWASQDRQLLRRTTVDVTRSTGKVTWRSAHPQPLLFLLDSGVPRLLLLSTRAQFGVLSQKSKNQPSEGGRLAWGHLHFPVLFLGAVQSHEIRAELRKSPVSLSDSQVLIIKEQIQLALKGFTLRCPQL